MKVGVELSGGVTVRHEGGHNEKKQDEQIRKLILLTSVLSQRFADLVRRVEALEQGGGEKPPAPAPGT